MLAVLVVLLVAAAPAAARMQVGFQADGPVVGGTGIGRERALDTMRAGGGEWLRVMVREDRWPADAGRYRDAIAAARARGLQVMATLMRWRGRKGTERPGATVREWSAFVSDAVRQLGPYVDAWGSSNEPNHPAFAPHAATSCHVGWGSRGNSHSTRVVDGKQVIVRYRRVQRGRGTHRRVRRYRRAKHGRYRRAVRHRRGGRRDVRYVRSKRRTIRRYRRRDFRVSRRRYDRRVRYRRARTGAQRRRANYVQRVRRIPLTRTATIYLSTQFEQRACEQQAWAAAYRPIHDVTARIVRQLDAGAVVIVGDLAPSGGNAAFMEAMFAAAPGPVDADVLGIHAYSPGFGDPRRRRGSGGFWITSIEGTVARTRAWQAQGRLTGGQTWITESGFVPSAPADYWTWALERAAAAGVPVMILYELTQHPLPGRWDTGLLDAAGAPRPAWHAVTGWMD